MPTSKGPRFPIDPGLAARARATAERQRNSEDVPAPQGRIAIELATAISETLPMEHLSFGGGTVLAARWNHRTSTDVDLFATPAAWEALSDEQHEQIEARLQKVDGYAAERSWSGPHQLYAEIRGTEATVLPRLPGPVPPTGEQRYLSGTELRLQGNAEILHGKMRHRLTDQYVVAVRDAYDICSAAIHDPEALRATVRHIGKDEVNEVCAMIRELAPGWSTNDPKAILNCRYEWNEAALTERLAQALEQAIAPPAKGRDR